ncbi:MAG: response regulator [Candidatus Binataceae bacterium]
MSRPELAERRGPLPRVLVVEDEEDIRALVRYNLEQEGFGVEEARDGAEGYDLIRRHMPDAMVLDLMLPGISGLELCQKLRTESPTQALPIIMLTAKSSEVDRILGLEMGADDYVVKPFSPRELVARIRAVLRRSHAHGAPAAGGPVYERGRLRIDMGTYEVFVEGKQRQLCLREFELLRFFAEHPMRVYSREQLLDLVWGRDVFVEPRTVDVHVRRLRRQIERDDSRPELILTVRSVGYRFNPEALG